MLLYRTAKQKYLEDLRGLGGSYANGARWNKPHTPVLYFAMSAAVAQLEMANYTSSPRMLPPSTRLGVYEIPDDTPVDRLNWNDLPDDWTHHPFPESTQEIGEQWFKSSEAFGLIVPSCAVAAGLGDIMVVNPAHNAIDDIKLIDTIADIYNSRAFNGIKS